MSYHTPSVLPIKTFENFHFNRMHSVCVRLTSKNPSFTSIKQSKKWKYFRKSHLLCACYSSRISNIKLHNSGTGYLSSVQSAIDRQ